jgi:hypothetical protein
LASAFALSQIVGRLAGGYRYSGLLGVVGLFFYGSIGSLFASQQNSSSAVPGAALLFELPYVNLWWVDFGGPFAHVILGHSLLYGLIGTFAAVGLLLAKLRDPGNADFRPDVLTLLPGLVISLNVIAGLGVVGVVAASILFYGRQKPWAWLSSALVLSFFVSVAALLGYWGSSSAAGMQLDPHLARNWFGLFIWFFIGLGIRIYALRWIKGLWTNPASLVLGLFFAGYVVFPLVTYDPFDSHDLYSFRFLQALLSVFGLVALGADLGNNIQWDVRAKAVTMDLLRIAIIAASMLLVAAVVSIVGEFLRPEPSDETLWLCKLTVESAVIVLALSVAGTTILRRPYSFVGTLATGILVVYCVGFLAWLPPWLNFGMGRMNMDITVESRELFGLRRLKESSEPSDLIATNRHSIDSLPERSARSYVYRALTERPILIEGWEYGEKYDPQFEAVREDNDALFITHDERLARDIVDKYGIDYIVLRPGSDIEGLRSRVVWLEALPDTGTLRIYRVKH